MNRHPLLVFASLGILILSGLSCGYTTQSALPPRFQNIYVETFKNQIDFTSAGSRNLYFPLIEVDLRNAINERLLFVGALDPSDRQSADMILTGALTSYTRQPLRFTDSDNVQEYRVLIFVTMTLFDTLNEEVVWTETSFAGEGTYFIEGPQTRPEKAAVEDAIEDLARRIVERIIENW